MHFTSNRVKPNEDTADDDADDDEEEEAEEETVTTLSTSASLPVCVIVSRRRPVPPPPPDVDVVDDDEDQEEEEEEEVDGRVTPSHVEGVLSRGDSARSGKLRSASAAGVPGVGPVAAAYEAARLNRY